jgi:hypothetical protein
MCVFLIDSGDGLTGQWRRAHRTALEFHTHSTSLWYCFSGFHSTHWCYLHTTNSSDLGPFQTRGYLLKQCRRWEDQEVIIRRDVRRATNEALLQLFGDERCTT